MVLCVLATDDLSLQMLEELDEIEIVLEERLLYKGVLGTPLAVKIAENALKERIDKIPLKKRDRKKMNEEEKEANIKEFIETDEMDGITKQTEDLIKNSHKRLAQMRAQSFKTVEGIHDKFLKLMRVTEDKWGLNA